MKPSDSTPHAPLGEIVVTQADRDAAALLHQKQAPWMDGMWERGMRAGNSDDTPIVRAFARHRLSGLSQSSGAAGDEAAVAKVADEYRSSMGADVLHSWAVDAVETIRAMLAFRSRNTDSEGGWRPIAEAPANESVLVYIPRAEHYGEGIYRAMLVDMGTGRRWMTTGCHIGRDCTSETQPTHFRPLPAPPSETSV